MATTTTGACSLSASVSPTPRPAGGNCSTIKGIAELVGPLAGVDEIRVWHDPSLFKPPHGNPTSWHLAPPSWSFPSRDALSIWIARDEATVATGCRWSLPGAHMTPRPRRAMTGAYTPDGCTFNGMKNVRPQAMFDRLKPGDPLDDPQQNPLLWSRK